MRRQRQGHRTDQFVGCRQFCPDRIAGRTGCGHDDDRNDPTGNHPTGNKYADHDVTHDAGHDADHDPDHDPDHDADHDAGGRGCPGSAVDHHPAPRPRPADRARPRRRRGRAPALDPVRLRRERQGRRRHARLRRTAHRRRCARRAARRQRRPYHQRHRQGGRHDVLRAGQAGQRLLVQCRVHLQGQAGCRVHSARHAHRRGSAAHRLHPGRLHHSPLQRHRSTVPEHAAEHRDQGFGRPGNRSSERTRQGVDDPRPAR